jgi:two-component sensor histidine kinase/CheY-like chemotaxis protein
MHVLIIEDDPLSLRLIEEYIASFTRKVVTKVVRSCNEAEISLQDQNFDIALLDLNLPDSKGIESFMRILKLAEDIPVIVLSGTEDSEIALKTVRAGAQDYLVKSHFDGYLLERSIFYAIERKRSEKQIKYSLREKEALIREIHHRVKNNLQIICSLLSLHSRFGESESLKFAFAEMRSRIVSMSLIHDELYQSGSFASLDCSRYTERLVLTLVGNSTKNLNAMEHHFSLEPLQLSMDQAVPYALLLNELISNALNHGIDASGQGTLWVTLTNLDGNYVKLLVEDDGPGLPQELDLYKEKSFGMLLLKTLSEQLEGKITYEKTERCSFSLIFYCDISASLEGKEV